MDIYDEILKDYYSEYKEVRNYREMQNNLLIRFLNNFSNKIDVSLIKNGIIFILALSSDIVHDRFHLECRTFNELNMNEKSEVISLLKSEFNIGTKIK